MYLLPLSTVVASGLFVTNLVDDNIPTKQELSPRCAGEFRDPHHGIRECTHFSVPAGSTPPLPSALILINGAGANLYDVVVQINI